MHVPMRAMAKIAAHTVDATCLDWHPTRPYVIATGGAGDRCVKGTCSRSHPVWHSRERELTIVTSISSMCTQ